MSRFCVVEGTKITLNDKETVPIESIKVGQEVLSFNLNTLQKSQKYDILVKLKTNQFEGIFQEDLVKNVWKNTVDEYYLINDKLKITKDHIVLAKRNQTYYWTKVEQLLIDDYLFTELNIFERIKSIIIVKEPVKVFNLEVNRVFNYFANSYLIHNGAPCAACLACGNEFYFFGDSSPATIEYNSINYKGGVADGGYSGGGSLGETPVHCIFTVPLPFDKVHFEIYGADGGLNDPDKTSSDQSQEDHGRGAYIRGHFRIRDDEDDTTAVHLHIGVGETWDMDADNTSSKTTYNGGGAGANRKSSATLFDGYNGGGATHIAYATDSSLDSLVNLEDLNSKESNIIVVAGGGGGSAWTTEQTSSDQQGGNGGEGTAMGVTITSPSTGTVYPGSNGVDGHAVNRRGGTAGSNSAGQVQQSPWENDDDSTDYDGGFGEGGWRSTSGGSAHQRLQSPPADSDGSAWQGGGGGSGWFGGGAGSGAGGGGGGGSSYVKGTVFSDGTVVNVTDNTSGRIVVIENKDIRDGTVFNSTPKNSHTSDGSNMGNSDRRGSGFVKLVLGNYGGGGSGP